MELLARGKNLERFAVGDLGESRHRSRRQTVLTRCRRIDVAGAIQSSALLEWNAKNT